jgi:hypothetical protein
MKDILGKAGFEFKKRCLTTRSSGPRLAVENALPKN